MKATLVNALIHRVYREHVNIDIKNATDIIEMHSVFAYKSSLYNSNSLKLLFLFPTKNEITNTSPSYLARLQRQKTMRAPIHSTAVQ